MDPSIKTPQIQSRIFVVYNNSESVSRPAPRQSKTCSRISFKALKDLSPWAWEIFCATSSLLCAMALTIVLKTYDGRLLTDWNAAISMGETSLDVSINTVVSLLGTFSKALFMVCVASGLSQYKWIWFASHKRPLLDFERFEDASRDPLGSLYLLLITRVR